MGEAYLVSGAQLQCDKGSLSTPLLVTNPGIALTGKFQANKMDFTPGTNILPFGICKKTKKICALDLIGPWLAANGSQQVGGQDSITTGSILVCALGGMITPLTSGQGISSPASSALLKVLEAIAFSRECIALLLLKMKELEEKLNGKLDKETEKILFSVINELTHLETIYSALKLGLDPYNLPQTVDFLSRLMLNHDLIAENYLQNRLILLENFPNALDKNELIIDQSKLSAYRYGLKGSDYNGCGWISIYNAMKILSRQEGKPFATKPEDIIKFMESQSPLSGLMLGGIVGTHPSAIQQYLKEMGYTTRVYYSEESIKEEAGKASVNIILRYGYGEHGFYGHYVTFDHVEDDQFQFYNETLNQSADIRTLDQFLDTSAEIQICISVIKDGKPVVKTEKSPSSKEKPMPGSKD